MTPQANIVCFRPEPPHDIEEPLLWNDVVKALRKAHLDQGSGYVVQTEFDGKTWLRCTLMNPLTEERDLERMLTEFESFLPSAMSKVLDD